MFVLGVARRFGSLTSWSLQPNKRVHDKTIDIIDTLVYDARTVVQMACESFMSRVGTQLDRSKKVLLNPNMSVYQLLRVTNPLILF